MLLEGKKGSGGGSLSVLAPPMTKFWQPSCLGEVRFNSVGPGWGYREGERALMTLEGLVL